MGWSNVWLIRWWNSMAHSLRSVQFGFISERKAPEPQIFPRWRWKTSRLTIHGKERSTPYDFPHRSSKISYLQVVVPCRTPVTAPACSILMNWKTLRRCFRRVVDVAMTLQDVGSTPRVNVDITKWKDPPFLMGKVALIFYGHVQ